MKSSGALNLSQRLQMVSQHVCQSGRWQASEAAIGAEAEIRNVLSRGCDTLLESRHVMDGTEVDAGALRLEILQRREKSIIAAVERRDVNPIHAPAGRRHKPVRECDCLTKIIGHEARPAAERAKTKVITERHVRRNVRRQIANLVEVALDRAFQRQAGAT